MNPQIIVSVTVQVPAGVTPPDPDAILAPLKKSKAFSAETVYMVSVTQSVTDAPAPPPAKA